MRLRPSFFSKPSTGRLRGNDDSAEANEGVMTDKDVQGDVPPQDSKTPSTTPTPDNEDGSDPAASSSVSAPAPIATTEETPSLRRKKKNSTRPAPSAGTKSTIWPWRRFGHVRSASGRMLSSGDLMDEKNIRIRDMGNTGLYAGGIHTAASAGGKESGGKESGAASVADRRRAHSDNTKTGRSSSRRRGRRSSSRDKVWVTTAAEVAAALGAEEGRRRQSSGGPESLPQTVDSPTSRRYLVVPLRRAHSSSSLTRTVNSRPLTSDGVVSGTSTELEDCKAEGLEGYGTDDDTDYDDDYTEDLLLRPRYCGREARSEEGDTSSEEDYDRPRAGLGSASDSCLGGSYRHTMGREYPESEPGKEGRRRTRRQRKGEEDVDGDHDDGTDPSHTKKDEYQRFVAGEGFFTKENGTEEMGKILESDDMRAAFRQFLSKRWCVENLDFIEVVSRYQEVLNRCGSRDPEVMKLSEEIESTYVLRGSPREVNIGHDMRRACLANRARDVSAGEASQDTFSDVALELISMMNHTMMRDFKGSAAYATIEACLNLGPRDTRNSGATSSLTYEDDSSDKDDFGQGVAMCDGDEPGGAFTTHDQRDGIRPKSCMSEAYQHVADWYGLADDAHRIRPRTWC